MTDSPGARLDNGLAGCVALAGVVLVAAAGYLSGSGVYDAEAQLPVLKPGSMAADNAAGAAEEGTRLEFLRGHPPQLPESTTLDGGSSADEKVPDLAALAAGAEGAAGSPNTAALAGDDGMGGFDV